MNAVRARGLRFAAGGLGLLVVAATALAGFAVLRALWAQSHRVALVGAAVTFALLLVLACALWRDRAWIGRTGWWGLVVAAAVGLACGGALAERETATARDATFHYSDGSTHDAGAPRVLSAWGRELPGYALHPAYPGARVAHGLEARFNHAPGKVKASFSKPESALLMPDGKPTRSDGVRIRATMVAPDGALSPEQVIDLAQGAFVASRWVHHEFRSDDGIAALRLTVEAGPPGATTFYDATLIGLKATPWTVHAARAGKAVLVAFAFAVCAWWLAAWSVAGARGDRAALRDMRRGWIALAVAAAVILGVGGWSLAESEVIYFWDARNYWHKTELLHELMVAGDWAPLVGLVADAATQEYSMFPALLPAAVAALFPQGPTRVVFGMILLVLYVVPAYVATAWLGSRFVAARGAPTPAAWLLATVAVFVAVPIPFTRALLLMPDMGGIVLMVLAWSAAAALLRACIEAGEPAVLLRSAALLGVTCAAMFLFRRWYVFAAVGLALVAAVLLLAEFVRTPAGRGALARRAGIGAAVVAAAAFPLLCWVAFAWSQSTASHDYATLYASYRNAWASDVLRFQRGFGAAALLLAVVGLVLAWPDRRGDLRRRWWLLVGGTVLAFGGFLYVQSPGPHHYNLLVPCIGGAVAVVALRLAARFGLRALLAFVLAIVAGNLVAMRMPGDSAWRAWFPGYALWLPRHTPALDAWREIAAWATAPGRQDRTLCVVASSSPINQGIAAELWQLTPGMPRDAFTRRMVSLAEVDSRDGAPRGIERCELALVGDPFQTHLAPGQQDNVAVVRDALIAGRGVGAAFRAGRSFAMADGARLVVYERMRPVTAAEVDELKQRWREGEAAQAARR